jgi:hypothetical protein
MVEVVKLKPDGENWSEWRKSTQKIAEIQCAANYLVGTPPEPFREVFNSLARCTIECTIPKSISRHFQHYTTVREYINYLTKRFDKSHQSEQAKTNRRVGKEGGKINEGIATARGPGTKTTDLQADGISLVTLASSPRMHHTFVKPTETPETASTATPQRIPHDNGSHGEDQSVAGIKQGGGADEELGQQVDDKTADIANPHTTCAGSTRPAGTSQNMPVESQPPHGQSGATSQVRMPPSKDTSDGAAQGAMGDEVEGREMDDDEDC